MTCQYLFVLFEKKQIVHGEGLRFGSGADAGGGRVGSCADDLSSGRERADTVQRPGAPRALPKAHHLRDHVL